jgi:DNA-binding Lrp family transcriptional regulator
MNVYILINAEAGEVWKITDSALKIEGVKMARSVTGQFDVILYAQFAKMTDLSDLIKGIQSLNGVIKTQTAVVMPLSQASDK